jgi:ribosomal protein S18 acetylase RimI-like enzyme
MMANDTLDICLTRADEAEPVVEVARQARVFSDEEVVTVGEMVQDWVTKGEDSSYRFLSCRLDGRVVGFAAYGRRWLTNGTFDLYWLGASSNAQRRGVGSALIAQVEQNVRAMGGRLLIVETSDRPAYEPARRFYDAHGYRREALIEDFYDVGDSLVVYSKRLD